MICKLLHLLLQKVHYDGIPLKHLANTPTCKTDDLFLSPLQFLRYRSDFLTERNAEQSSVVCINRKRNHGLDLFQNWMYRKVLNSQCHQIGSGTDLDGNVGLPDNLQVFVILVWMDCGFSYKKQTMSKTIRSKGKNVLNILTFLKFNAVAATLWTQNLGVGNLADVDRGRNGVFPE